MPKPTRHAASKSGIDVAGLEKNARLLEAMLGTSEKPTQMVVEGAINSVNERSNCSLSRLCQRMQRDFAFWRRDTALSLRVQMRHVRLKATQYDKTQQAGHTPRSHPAFLVAMYQVLTVIDTSVASAALGDDDAAEEDEDEGVLEPVSTAASSSECGRHQVRSQFLGSAGAKARFPGLDDDDIDDASGGEGFIDDASGGQGIDQDDLDSIDMVDLCTTPSEVQVLSSQEAPLEPLVPMADLEEKVRGLGHSGRSCREHGHQDAQHRLASESSNGDWHEHVLGGSLRGRRDLGEREAVHRRCDC